ncbi:MAG: DNA-protecting protein DprA, partial [Pseudomonadota bacterium]
APTATHNITGFAEAPGPSLKDTAALHSQILSRLSPSPIAEDQLTRDMKKSAAIIAPAVVELELQGQIQRHPGGLISKKS